MSCRYWQSILPRGAFALTTAALVASLAPVVRAARVDPMVALRFD